MKSISKNKIYMIFGIVVLLIAIAGSAYAYYSSTASASIGGTVAGSANLDLKVEKISTGATGNLIPVDNDTTTLTKAVIGEGNTSYDNSKRCIDKNGYTACQIYKITLTNKSSVSVSVDGGVSLSGDNTPNIECAKMDDINTVSSNSSCKSSKSLAKNYTMDANASVVYYIMVYIKNIDGVQTDTGDFSGTVFFSAGSGNKIDADFNTIETAADTITNLYKNAAKTTVTNNSIEYNYASSVSLMNDRLGGTTTSLDEGNIRYYGASPNNYIYFNCSDYSNQSSDTCELWRIIGVFNNQVKIMRNASIYSSLQSLSVNEETSTVKTTEYKKTDPQISLLAPSDLEENDYAESYLQNTLNDNYYNSLSGTYDFTSIGIKNEETRKKIAKVKWNLGSVWCSNEYSNYCYTYERNNYASSGHSTYWTGNIAVPYPSDYGYAADFASCSKTLSEYNDSTCTSTNYLYTVFSNSGEKEASLLSPLDSDYSVWYVKSDGMMTSRFEYRISGAFPTLFLNSTEALYEDNSDGSSTNPYKLTP